MMRWMQRCQRSSGQVAVMFVVIIALIIALGAFTMNLGEVARLKTSTANAADAGALAAASWIASGQNEVAKIARGMWINVYLLQAIFLYPFCKKVCHWAVILTGLLALVNGVFMLEEANEKILHGAWDRAHADAFFMAMQNLLIDDRSGKIKARTEDMAKKFQDNQELPPARDCSAAVLSGLPTDAHCLEWERPDPAGHGRRKHWVAIQIEFSSGQPELQMSNWGPWGFCMLNWWHCKDEEGDCCLSIPGIGCVWPCFQWPASWRTWGKPKAEKAAKGGAKFSVKGIRKAAWEQLVGFLPRPWAGGTGNLGPCGFCLPIPTNILYLPTKPRGITNGSGEVKVTVRYHRQGGTVEGAGGRSFWTTRYPSVIVSEATAGYTGADVGSFGRLPQARAFAELVKVTR